MIPVILLPAFLQMTVSAYAGSELRMTTDGRQMPGDFRDCPEQERNEAEEEPVKGDPDEGSLRKTDLLAEYNAGAKEEEEMVVSEERKVHLNNGIEMDRVGMGCWESRGQEAVQAVGYAVKAGYRRIDTARYYENEKEVGEGIRTCGVQREELFVTTKLWHTDMCGGRQEEAFYQSMEDLGLEYLDMYLLHWPIGDIKESWRVLEKLYEEGKIRAIGVSNFQPIHLQRLLADANVCPAVNQFESNPSFSQDALREYCLREGIVPEAWGPLGKGRDLGLPVFEKLSHKYERTPAQIILRWHLQRRMAVIPKSVHEERLKENIDIFDFELEEEDMRSIDALDTGISVRRIPPEYTPQ